MITKDNKTPNTTEQHNTHQPYSFEVRIANESKGKHRSRKNTIKQATSYFKAMRLNRERSILQDVTRYYNIIQNITT